jgi:murein DD-endopeptidase MepM/ murein hydrolase activator NlpD
LSPDPFGGSANAYDPGSFNRYAYVGGDPINLNDPSGLEGIMATCPNMDWACLMMGWNYSTNSFENPEGAFAAGGGPAAESVFANDLGQVGPGSGNGFLTFNPALDVGGSGWNDTSGGGDGGDDGSACPEFADCFQGGTRTRQTGPSRCESAVLQGSPEVSSQYGEIGPSHPNPHSGDDYRVPVGTPVYAPEAGTITHGPPSATMGTSVSLQGTSANYFFFHLSGIAVPNGTAVQAGDLIAYTGNTGHSTGPHLHFEQTQAGPVYWDLARRVRVRVEPCEF